MLCVHTCACICVRTKLIVYTGRNILTRQLLGAKDLDEIKTILYNQGYGAAYGVK